MHWNKELHEMMRMYSSMKALQLLVALAESEGEVSLAKLSAATGIPPSSTHRILQEMQHCGFVIKDDVKKCYRVGFEARLLALQLQKTNFLNEAAKAEMTYLNDLSLETIHLIGEEDQEAVYLAKLGAKNSVGLHSAVGKRIPLHCTSGGKALLAWKSEKWLNSYLEHNQLARYTPLTICDPDSLRRELEVIRIQGYAVDNHEHHTDVVCIAAPIFDVGNTAVAAISIAAPDYRFSLEKALSYTIMLGLIIVNIFMYLQGRVFIRGFVNITRVPTSTLVPILVILCVIGAFAIDYSSFNAIFMVGVGVFGYFMTKLDMPMTPMVIGLVLGKLCESNLRRALIVSKGSWATFFTSPISCFFILLSVFMLAFPYIKKKLAARKAAK